MRRVGPTKAATATRATLPSSFIAVLLLGSGETAVAAGQCRGRRSATASPLARCRRRARPGQTDTGNHAPILRQPALADTLERMVGNVMDHDVKISDRIGRKKTKPQLAKTVGEKAFAGKIIVLVDSQSASAAELFARVMQLEHRGIVLGDRTSGSVMEAKGYGYSQGVDTVISYGFSVTDADLIMKDGKSLEHVGVTPDEVIIPTARDLATGRDPVLARAMEIAGGKLDPADAGKLFPFEWIPF